MQLLGRRWVLVLALVWAVAIGDATSAYARVPGAIFDRIASDITLSLFRDTAAGRELALKLIGREVSSGSDVAAMELRLQALDVDTSRVRMELERRVGRIDSELRSQQSAGPLSVAQRSRALEDLSGRFLAVEIPTKPGRIWFVTPLRGPPVAAAGNYDASRAEFVRAISPRSLGSTFDTAIVIEPGSIDARLGAGNKISERLAALEQKYFYDQHLMQPDEFAEALARKLGVNQVSVGQVIEGMIELRQAMASELRGLAGAYRAQEPVLASTLEKAAGKVHLSEHALAHFKTRAVNSETHVSESGLQREVRALNEVLYKKGERYEDVRGYTGTVRGEMGEVRVAVRAGGLVERGLYVEDIGRYMGEDALGDAARAELKKLAGIYPQKIRKELDLILDQGMEWGEVKFYGDVFSPRHEHYDKVMKQARTTVEIKALFESSPAVASALKAIGKTIQLRIYFLSGVTEAAALELEALGFKVFGVRYLAWEPTYVSTLALCA